MDNDLPHRPHRNIGPKSPHNFGSKLFLGILTLLIVSGLSFWAGSSYQKSQNTLAVGSNNSSITSTSSGSVPSRSGNFSRSKYGGLGSITAVSATSITTQNLRTGTTTTYSITSSTVITRAGESVSASALQVGTTVIITASSSAPTTASQVTVLSSSSSSDGPTAQGT